MTEPASNKILFVSQNVEESKEAEVLFQAEATKAELTWNAMSCGFPDVQQFQSSVNLIIQLEHNDIPHMVLPQSKTTTEQWRIGSATTIKQNISNLIVRLILKGGRRQSTSTVPNITAKTTAASKASGQAAVRVGLESKGRAGKKVTVISGLPLSDSEIEDLTTKLKRTCGTGGTFKDGQIEIQGDHRDKLISELQKIGYKPKRKGG